MNRNKKILIIGGSSGIGLATAQLLANEDHEIIIASRSPQKLEAAKHQIHRQNVTSVTVDITDEVSIEQLFQKIGNIDHLVLSGNEIQFSDFRASPIQEIQQSFNSKFFGPYRVIKQALPFLKPKSSIILFSGSAAAKPMKGSEIFSAINAAIEGFSRALAVNLAPIRVNTISPGIIDTPIYDKFDTETRKKIFDSISSNLLIKRVGTATEVAQAVQYLINNHYTTGSTLYVDGGHVLS